jgi:hypothetical protein
LSQEDVFTSLVKDVIPNKVISSFILIAEVTEADGKSLQIVMSDGMTRWMAEGMINCASDTMFTPSYDEDED